MHSINCNSLSVSKFYPSLLSSLLSTENVQNIGDSRRLIEKAAVDRCTAVQQEDRQPATVTATAEQRVQSRESAMGVTGLWALLKASGRQLRLDALRGQILAVGTDLSLLSVLFALSIHFESDFLLFFLTVAFSLYFHHVFLQYHSQSVIAAFIM